jgi:hypothetical protein
VRVLLVSSAWFAIGLTQSAGAVAATPSPQQGDALMAHFRSVWSSDQCVQQRESWDEYQGWLSRFYSGPEGWGAFSQDLTANITNATVHAKLANDLRTLGIRVSGEWAKDNACRKIRTTTGFFNMSEEGKPALSTWHDQLQAAAAADSGDGATLGVAVRQISRQVDALLKPQP